MPGFAYPAENDSFTPADCVSETPIALNTNRSSRLLRPMESELGGILALRQGSTGSHSKLRTNTLLLDSVTRHAVGGPS
jgi:hypothetical protein